MNDARPILEALLTRRSVRFGFEDGRVPREALQQIIACGLAAPSSKNAQPWRFHVVTDRSALAGLADLVAGAAGVDSYVPHDPRTSRRHTGYKSTVLDSAEVLRSVPAGIWIENLGVFSIGRRTLLEAAGEGLAGALVGYGLEILGIGAAIENMWIAGNALGLSVAFIGDVVIAESKIQEALGLQGDLIGVLVLGYSSASPRPPMDAKALASTDRVVWHE